MLLKYQSGEEIRTGDRVTFHGEPGEIEFVVEALVGDPARDWYIKEHGPGVMISEPKYFGPGVYISSTHEDKNLVFIGRNVPPDH